ncbi:hypothetical protein C8Q75DRAFT_498126 [Abortiporus biennis]|nr:hypothetical protein C8Q75DRAFT_498126 [Abortiporus biennis]
MLRAILCSLPMLHTLRLSGVEYDDELPKPNLEPLAPNDNEDVMSQHRVIKTLAVHDTHIIAPTCDISSCPTLIIFEPTTLEFTLDFSVIGKMKEYLSIPENLERLKVIRFRTTAQAASHGTFMFFFCEQQLVYSLAN